MPELVDKTPTEVPPGAAAAKPAGGVSSRELTRSAGRGALWQFAGAGWMTLVQLGSSAVLARVLFPEDFGLLGMALLGHALIRRLGTLGTTAGLIAKVDVTEDDLSTAFWTTFAVQGALFGVAVAAAPLAALFFDTPEVTWVMRAVALTFVLTALGAVPGAILRKKLRFGALKIIECGGAMLQAGLAILFAVVYDMNYWALVAGMLISEACQGVATLILARWRPSLRFRRESFRYMFRFGYNEFGSELAGYFHHNIDYLLVGRLLGPALLGLYEFAYRIPHMIVNRLAMPVGRVLFPSLAKIQSDNARLAKGYTKCAQYVSIAVFPLMTGLAVLARPTVLVLWGEKWVDAILPLQILCGSAAVRSALSGVGTIFLCKNRPDIPLKFSLATLAFTFAAVATLGYFFGMVGVATGMLVSLAPYVIYLGLAFRMVDTPVRQFFAALGPVVLCAAVCGLAAWGTMRLVCLAEGPDYVILLAAVPAGAAAYAAGMRLLYPKLVADVWETARVVLGRRSSEAVAEEQAP